MGSQATPAIPDLIQLYNIQADMALVAIGPATATEVPALTQLLDDENPDIRRSATKALAEIEK